MTEALGPQTCFSRLTVSKSRLFLDEQNAYFDSTNDRNRLRVGGEDGPQKVESFKELHSNMKNNMRTLQLQTVRSLVDKILKKKNENDFVEAEVQTLSTLEISGKNLKF